MSWFPEPVDGEAFDGYLDRACLHTGSTLAALTWAARHPASDDSTVTNPCWMPAHRAAIYDEVLELRPGSTAAMTVLGRYPHLYPQLATAPTAMDAARAAAREWVLFSHSRYCPGCLYDDGVWHLAWRIPWTLACPTHATLLLDACPACGNRPRSKRDGANTGTAFEYLQRNPRRCACSEGAAPRPLGQAAQHCDYPLSRAAAPPAPPTLLALQTRLDTALRGEPITVAGRPRQARDAIHAVRELVVLTHHFSSDASGQRTRPWLSPPRTVPAMAGHLSRLIPIITAPTPHTAADALSALVPSEVPVDANFFRDRLPQPPAIADLVELLLSRTGRFSTRIRRAQLRGRQDPLPLYDYTSANLPQRAWPCLQPTTLRIMTGKPSTAMRETVISLSLARLVTGDWGDAAEALGFPRHCGPQWVRYVAGNLDDVQRADLARMVTNVAAQLHAADLPDYTQHRAQIRNARDLASAQTGACPDHPTWAC